jgi:two-component system cell cycle response regulator CpdR
MADILVVEDDDAGRALVTRMLEAAGHRVTAVADGEAACAALAGGVYRLLVCDVHLPDIDGLEVARRARAFPYRPDVLLVSGFVEELARAEALVGPGVATLSKPFTAAAVRAAVEHLLARGP